MLRCMRTTIDIDDPLLRELKAWAAREGTTLGRLVNRLLRQSRHPAPKPKRRFRLTTFGGGGLQPGVSLEDRDSLFDLMDGRR